MTGSRLEATAANPKRTIAMGALLQGVGGGLGWSVIPPLLPRIAVDLHLSHAMGGVVWGAAPLGIALASPLGGAAVDRLGARRVAGVAMLFGALACAARALAHSPWALVAAMFAFGLHIGFVAPAVPKALAGHVPLARLARANGLALLAYTLGTAATVLTARTVLLPAAGGWRPLMVAVAGAMALAGILWLIVVRDRIAPMRHARFTDSLRLIGHRSLRLVACMHFLLFGGYLAMLGLLPRALLEAGLPPARVGVAIATWLAVAGFANFVGPWLSDRTGHRRPFLVAGAALAGGALALLSFAPAATAPWLLALAALGGGCVAPLLLSLPLELPGIGPARAGAALGLLMLVGQLGGFLLPIATGDLGGRAGFGAAIALLAAVHMAIVVPALALGRRESVSDGTPTAITTGTKTEPGLVA